MSSFVIQIIMTVISTIIGVIAFFGSRYFLSQDKKEDRDFNSLIKKIDDYDKYKEKDLDGIRLKLDHLEKEISYKIDSVKSEINKLALENAKYSERLSQLFVTFKEYVHEQNHKNKEMDKKINDFGKVTVKK